MNKKLTLKLISMPFVLAMIYLSLHAVMGSMAILPIIGGVVIFIAYQFTGQS